MAQVKQHGHLRDVSPMADALPNTSVAMANAAVCVNRARRPKPGAYGRHAGTMDALSIPYLFFRFRLHMSEVVLYARQVDSWMQKGGRAQIAIAGHRQPP